MQFKRNPSPRGLDAANQFIHSLKQTIFFCLLPPFMSNFFCSTMRFDQKMCCVFMLKAGAVSHWHNAELEMKEKNSQSGGFGAFYFIEGYLHNPACYLCNATTLSFSFNLFVGTYCLLLNYSVLLFLCPFFGGNRSIFFLEKESLFYSIEWLLATLVPGLWVFLFSRLSSLQG